MIFGNVEFFSFVDWFLVFFLDNYPTKSDIGLIDPTGCWKLTLIVCYAQFFQTEVIALKQVKITKIGPFLKFFSRLENYHASSQVCVQSRNLMLGIFYTFPAANCA